jgi:hypothetical protein
VSAVSSTVTAWSRRTGTHLPWCGRWCRATGAVLGEHCSDPITTRAAVGGASVVGTRIAQADGRQHLELRINIPLPSAGEAIRAAVAGRVLRAITAAILRAAGS